LRYIPDAIIMSDTFRQAMLNKIPRLPPTRAPWADEPPAGEEEELEDDLGALGLGPSASSSSSRVTQDYSPISAAAFFDQALEVNPSGSDTTFRVYITAPTAVDTSAKGKGKETYVVCHHGAGAGGLSFAALARMVKEVSRGELGVLAFDCRGHGEPPLLLSGSADWKARRGQKGASQETRICRWQPC
jgi:protein phosphatase methylesterase 1